MRRAGSHSGKGAVELIEEAIHLLRRAPAGTLAVYYAGTLPFVLGLLYFWSDMSRSPYALQHLADATLGMAALFVWMKCWQTAFARRLRAALTGAAAPRLGWRQYGRIFLTQTALQPTGLFVLPLAAIPTLPLPWVYAFYQNLTVAADGESAELRPLLKQAARQATLWPRQNCLLLTILSGFGLYVFLNWASVCLAAPELARKFLGVESMFTRSTWSLLNTTFFAAMFCLTYACVDPILKAAYVLRCFYGDSVQSGEDLKVELRGFAARAGQVAVCLVVLAMATANSLAGVRPSSGAASLERASAQERAGSPGRMGVLPKRWKAHEAGGTPTLCRLSALGMKASSPRPSPPEEEREQRRTPGLKGCSSAPSVPPLLLGRRGPGRGGPFCLRSESLELNVSGAHPALRRFRQPALLGLAAPGDGRTPILAATQEPAREEETAEAVPADPRAASTSLKRGVNETVTTAERAQKPAGLSAAELDRTIQKVIQGRKYTWRAPRERLVEPEAKQQGIVARFIEKVMGMMRDWTRTFFEWLGKLLEKFFRRLAFRSATPFSSGWSWMVLLQMLLYALLIIVGAGLVWLLFRTWQNRARRPQPVESEPIRSAPDLTDENVGADELPEDGWTKLARGLLERGELRLALRAFYLASLAHLASRNLISLAKFKSNRDYERELQRRGHSFPDLLALFGENVLVFDRIWYGLHEVNGELVGRFAENVERIRSGSA